MSELKAFDVGLGQYCEDGSPCVVAFDADRNPRLLNEKVYLKSEADKVIEDKDGRIDLYKRGFEESDRINAHIYKELRHNKYKRCLAMARWCERKRIDAADYRIPREKWEFYDKWHKHWLELAEKFKEA